MLFQIDYTSNASVDLAELKRTHPRYKQDIDASFQIVLNALASSPHLAQKHRDVLNPVPALLPLFSTLQSWSVDCYPIRVYYFMADQADLRAPRLVIIHAVQGLPPALSMLP